AEFYGATLYVPKHLITPEIQAMIDGYLKDYETEISEGNGIFVLHSPEARWGEFEEIEAALVKAKIPFDRETAADYAGPSFTIHFRLGLTETPRYVCGVIDVIEVKDLIKAGGLEALQEKLAKDYPDFPSLEGMKESEVA
ncbi:MAG: hypothetical protein WC443_12470, partial [Desulfobaccales bacterium]